MDQHDNRGYYSARAASARRLAAAAIDPYIGQIHLELARLYDATLIDINNKRGDTRFGEPVRPSAAPVVTETIVQQAAPQHA